MKPFGFLFMLLLIWAAVFMYLGCSKEMDATSNPGHNTALPSTANNRKLVDNVNDRSTDEDDRDAGDIHLEDYRPINPVPTSKASVRPKPIQHGTPLMPYIPKPSPPPGNP